MERVTDSCQRTCRWAGKSPTKSITILLFSKIYVRYSYQASKRSCLFVFRWNT